MGTRTVTIDTNEMLYTDQNGVASYVNNASTFTISVGGSGTDKTYTITTVTPLTLANGKKIRFDTAKTSFEADTNATAKLNAGSIWIEEDNGYKTEWKIRTITLDNVATPTQLTLVMERKDNPMITCSLTTITVGA
jgi:hypothetical protein